MNPIDKALFHILQRCGLIAILRGVQPHEVVPIGHALYDACLLYTSPSPRD